MRGRGGGGAHAGMVPAVCHHLQAAGPRHFDTVCLDAQRCVVAAASLDAVVRLHATDATVVQLVCCTQTLRVKTARLLGTQSLARYIGWRGDRYRIITSPPRSVQPCSWQDHHPGWTLAVVRDTGQRRTARQAMYKRASEWSQPGASHPPAQMEPIEPRLDAWAVSGQDGSRCIPRCLSHWKKGDAGRPSTRSRPPTPPWGPPRGAGRPACWWRTTAAPSLRRCRCRAAAAAA